MQNAVRRVGRFFGVNNDNVISVLIVCHFVRCRREHRDWDGSNIECALLNKRVNPETIMSAQ